MYSIYVIIDWTNNKMYVGQAQNFRARWSGHKSAARCGDKHPLYNAMRKHGLENFTCNPIIEVETQEEADYQENIWIVLLRAHRSQDGYVVSLDGKGHVGFTEEDSQRTEKARAEGLRNRPGPHHSRRTDVDTEIVLKMYYEDGIPVKEIAQTLLCNVDTVRSRMTEAGRPPGRGKHVKTHVQKTVRKNLDEELIKNLYLLGYPTEQVASKIGCSRSTILKRLKEQGITLRTTSEAWEARNSLGIPTWSRSQESNNKSSESLTKAWAEGRHNGNRKPEVFYHTTGLPGADFHRPAPLSDADIEEIHDGLLVPDAKAIHSMAREIRKWRGVPNPDAV